MTASYKFSTDGRMGVQKDIEKDTESRFPTTATQIPTISEWNKRPSDPVNGEEIEFAPTSTGSVVMQYTTASSKWRALSTKDEWVTLPVVSASSRNKKLFPLESSSSIGSVTVNNNNNLEVKVDDSSQSWRFWSDFLLPRRAGVVKTKGTGVENAANSGQGPASMLTGMIEGNIDGNQFSAFCGLYTAPEIKFQIDSGSLDSLTTPVTFTATSLGSDYTFAASCVEGTQFVSLDWWADEGGTEFEQLGQQMGPRDSMNEDTKCMFWVKTDSSYDSTAEHVFTLKELQIKI